MTSIRCTTHHHACKCREEKFRQLEQQLADMRYACEQKQEIINSFAAVDEMRRAEFDELQAKYDSLLSLG